MADLNKYSKKITKERHPRNKDLTIIFLTLNKLPEKWVKFQREMLEEAMEDAELITISRKPMDWGVNLIQDTVGYSNIYWQMLRGFRLAKTPYVAMAEDDVLYSNEHFKFRPPMDTFAYNMTRWGIFTWGTPTYFWKDRMVNSVMIGPRDLAIEALEERFAKYPDGIPEDKNGELGRKKIEERLGVTIQKIMPFWTVEPVVCFNHKYAMDRLEKTRRKAMWFVQAYDIPRWGRSDELIKKFI